MEKLLAKNYYLHQSAKDGYRSYLQAYASYSLKKIFDVNALDLAKVGKSFGFAVPPRVNVNIGAAKGPGASSSVRKRRREDGEDEDETVFEEVTDAQNVDTQQDDEDVDDEESGSRSQPRRQGKQRRIETLGKKKVEKEIYKKGRDREKMKGSAQWSR